LEEEYRLQSGDTFASVSKRFYFTDKYSIALQQYNRDYPIGAANLKLDPPRLTAGTVVWIPPIRILEKRYPTMIADYKPLANAAVAGPATAAAPAWTGAPARQVAATTKTYRVRDGGESMHDIARRSLGHPLAWNTIYQLNPSLNPNPTAPIPAGTLLRVPGDARD
jgi:nucleoid-associated protein YgaU